MVGTAGDSTGLEAADSLLAPFYETVFRCYLKRCRGEGEGPAPDPPASIRPYVRFNPAKAVLQPQVRAVLREALATDAELRAMCVVEAGSAATETAADALRLVESGDERGLSQLVSKAALHRHAGWETIVWLGAAAATARDRTRAGDLADREAAVAAAERRERRHMSKLEKARDKAESGHLKSRAEVEELRHRCKDLRREADRAARERDEAHSHGEDLRARLEAAEAAAHALELDREEARRGRDEAAASFDRERRELHARIRSLESMRVPDLEAPARAIEDVAGRLRRIQADLTATSAAGPSSRAGSARGAADRGASRTPHPSGVNPGTRDALRWALRQPTFVILVDAYNVILEARRGWPDMRGPDQRQLLLSRCEAMLVPDGAEMHVVFDSSEEETQGQTRRQHPRVRHEFTAGETADDRLVEIAAALPVGMSAYAVTSDRELRERLGAHGVATVSSEIFL
ncbi:MAG: NYN domain-containing protein, partial [Acidimicrobiia bacterium]|nr:NYN domain-containing protein [Acidimicrobiia bacterium]